MKQILNQALECASRGIMIQDINRKVLFFNRACEEITKWSKEKIIGQSCGAIFKCHTSTGLCLTDTCCPGTEILNSRASSGSRELLIRRGDGTESWVKMSVSPIRNAKGEVTSIVSVIEDINEIKKFSDELLKSKTLSTLGAFASELAHEIKNPLNAMSIQLSLLEHEMQEKSGNGDRTNTEPLEIISIVKKELYRLSGFVEECLHFSKTGELHKSYVDVHEMLRTIISLLTPQAQLNGIHIELVVSEDVPKIFVDRDKIKQAILNIMINGIEAMPDGGTLYVNAVRCEDEIWFSCHDTGPGIPDEVKDKIFNLFYTTKGGGSGIGLSSAQNIIHAHGGNITLEQTSKGSKFVIALPINTEVY